MFLERRLADYARQCQGSYQVDLDTVITLTRAIAGTARRVAGTALKLAVNKFDDAQRRSDVTNAVNKLKNSTCVNVPARSLNRFVIVDNQQLLCLTENEHVPAKSLIYALTLCRVGQVNVC